MVDLIPVEHDPFAAPSGLIQPGNINLNNRPIVRNQDGSISTVRSIGVNIGGKEVLIPTVDANGGGILSNEDAINQYHRTGQHLGIFNTPENSTAYAEQLHRDQASRYAPSLVPVDHDPFAEGPR